MFNNRQKQAILDLFKMAVAEEQITNNKNDVDDLLKFGYVCDILKVDVKSILEWAKKNNFNPNKAFYATFEQVAGLTRFELFLDQIIHYYTSYTLEMDEPFVVNNEVIDLKKLEVKFIKSITSDEVIERCQNMLYSGVALKQNTIENILLIIGDTFIDVDKIKNREAQAIICINRGIFPNDPESALRCFIYQATGKTLLIKDKTTIYTLKQSNIIIPDILLEKFSKIFFRYKSLFLALKKNNQYKVNKLRRMANKNNVPFKTPFWSQIISTVINVDGNNVDSLYTLIDKRISDITTYKMIALYNLINIKLNTLLPYNMYVIRNGKMFMKEKNNDNLFSSSKTINRLIILKNKLLEHIVQKVKENVGETVIELPLNINLTCPTSEKSFMGEIPLYSWINMNFENVVIGIYWHEKDGARDLDLSFLDKSGTKIGWNADYYDENRLFIYSGDMTSAPNGASEMLYKDNTSDIIGVVAVNPFAYKDNKQVATYKVFFAKEEININKRRKELYMVDPDNIIYEYNDIIEGQKMLGTFMKNKFIFANLETSKNRVSNANTINEQILELFSESHSYYLTIDEVLKQANVSFKYSKDKILSKDDILKLFQ